jgi:hypothetical protein
MGDSFLSSVLSVVLQVLGVLVGGLITWWYSRRYYMLAARELRSEVVGLHTALNTVVNAVRQDKDALIELQRDGAGRLTGVKVSAVADVKGVAAVGAVGTVAPSSEM